MPIIDSENKEINFKIVYYGPALSGKTTSIQQLNHLVDTKKKSKVKKSTEAERTLFFDFLPLTSSEIKGFKPHFHIYTVPGQELYEHSRRLLLKGVDGIIFVADSQIDKIQENLKSFEELTNLLKNLGYGPHDIPLVIQYNKRDLPNAASLAELQKILNTHHVPDFEASAIKGEGVLNAFQACLRQVLGSLKSL